MSKRPSIIGDLPLEPEPAQATPTVAKVVKITASKPAPAADVVRSSIYLSPAAHDRLREIAFVERKKVHDLIVEGVDAVIAKRGHAESARRKPKAS
jgi:hypothetical protein